MWPHEYTTYILTNADRTVLYTGVTKDLRRRLIEHWVGSAGSFTTKYKVHFLVWFEKTRYIQNAIQREKDIKAVSRIKKDALITDFNPNWVFLNESILELRQFRMSMNSNNSNSLPKQTKSAPSHHSYPSELAGCMV